MKIIYKEGDLFSATEPAIIHGCNAQGVMGSGIAKIVKEKYPKAYVEYREKYHKNGRLNLGDLIAVQCSPYMIFNAITQNRYGRDGARYANYEAIALAFEKVDRHSFWDNNVKELALPKIGAGLGKGNWNIIECIIENTLVNVQPIVYSFDEI